MSEHLRKWFFILNKNRNGEYKGMKDRKYKGKNVTFGLCGEKDETKCMKKGGKNKNVTFNQVVSVVKVESFKRYYKENSYKMEFDYLFENDEHCFGCSIF